MAPLVILFYKRLVMLGGAEVLLAEHYAYLKAHGYAPKLVCFEHANLERIKIDPADIVVVGGGGAVAGTLQLMGLLRRLQAAQVFCHSGHVELGVAARLACVDYSVFLHQPTTMSYNETDKYAPRYFRRYKAFARRDRMFEEIVAAHAGLSWRQRLYVGLRSHLSQWCLRGARVLFVLSGYAVREKQEIFGLRARHRCGAISSSRIDELAKKSDLRPLAGEATLVSVSRLDENKRIDLLIDAVALMRDRGERVRLLIGGTGPAVGNLKKRVAEYKLEAAVTFLGYVLEKDIPALYDAMDLFVTIDWADFRITTYEVLAANRRVVVSDDTDIDERLAQSGYVFVSPADPCKLADIVTKALRTPVAWDRQQLAEYLRGYTWSAYFANIERAVTGHA